MGIVRWAAIALTLALAADSLFLVFRGGRRSIVEGGI